MWFMSGVRPSGQAGSGSAMVRSCLILAAHESPSLDAESGWCDRREETRTSEDDDDEEEEEQ